MNISDLTLTPMGAHAQVLHRLLVLQKIWRQNNFSLPKELKEEMDLLKELRKERVKEMMTAS